MHILVTIFLVVWFAMATLIGGVLFVAALLDAVEGDRRAVLIQVPLLLFAGPAIVGFGRLLARNEEKYLLDFVRYMLDAT